MTTPTQPPAAEPKHEWVDDGFEHRVVYSAIHSGLIHQMRRPATHREWPWQAAGDMYQADEIARLAAHSQAQAAELERQKAQSIANANAHAAAEARIAELERALVVYDDVFCGGAAAAVDQENWFSARQTVAAARAALAGGGTEGK